MLFDSIEHSLVNLMTLVRFIRHIYEALIFAMNPEIVGNEKSAQAEFLFLPGRS